MYKLKNHKISYYNILCFVICCFATFLHIYKLETLPTAINVDEAGLWYNVQCLLNWGIDQKGNSWPILLSNMWGEQSPMYTYLALICVKLFGNTLFAIRLPAVLNTFLVMIFGYKIVDLLFENKKTNLLFLCLVTITPYFTIISKMALDCNLMLGLSTIFLYCFLKALDTRNITWYVISGIVCGMTFWTYALSYLMIPLFLTLSLIYLFYIKKVTIKEIIVFFIPAFLLGLPLLIVQLINIFEWNEMTILGITFTNFEKSRHGDGQFSLNISNIIFNFCCAFCYIFNGFATNAYKSIYSIQGGYLLYITSFFIISGIFLTVRDCMKSIKTKLYDNKVFLLFWMIAILSVLLTLNKSRDLYQQCAIYIAYIILATYAIFRFYKLITPKQLKIIFIVLLVIIYIVSFSQFLFFYFIEYDDFASETNLMATKVPNEIHKLNGTTYFLKHYVYYQATYCVPPDKFNANDEDPFVYNNIIFGAYLEDITIETSCNYVVYYKDEKAIEILEEYDFEHKQVGDYIFFMARKEN